MQLTLTELAVKRGRFTHTLKVSNCQKNFQKKKNTKGFPFGYLTVLFIYRQSILSLTE